MPNEIRDRQEVQALTEAGAQLVEVLGAEEFAEGRPQVDQKGETR
jgi:hypothetical protein